jgi:putative transposase
MTCPSCRSRPTRKLALATELDYARFQCRNCRRTFNERTGTAFHFLEMPTDIVFQVVLFRLLFKLSWRDRMPLFLIRGYEFSDETVRDWEERFAPLLADQVRRRRQGRVGRCWHVDETHLNHYRLKAVGCLTTESRGTRLKPSEVFSAQSRLKARQAR